MSRVHTSGTPKIQREIRRPCPVCGLGAKPALNGAWFRRRRLDAHITLMQMSLSCGLSYSHLSKMERGQFQFQEGVAEIYERLIARRIRSGQE